MQAMPLWKLMSTAMRRGLALAYDDLLLVPNYSEVPPSEAVPAGRFSRNIPLRIPIVSAAMSTVTESKMAIAMAKAGGIGVIHPAMTLEQQGKMVRKVKMHLHARIDNPITILPEQTMQSVVALREEKDYGFSTFPVVGKDEIPVGLITSRDLRMHHGPDTTVAQCMKPFQDLVCGDGATSLKQAQAIMQRHHVNVLLLIADDGRLAGMYTGSDVDRALAPHNEYTLDARGHLRVAASIGFGDDALARAVALAKYGCDAFVVGTAHGDSKNVIETVRQLKKLYPDIDIVAGNVSYADGADRLEKAGADGILVGQGPGSICTTRVVAGIGVPQASAVHFCANAVDVPVIADGGISKSGQIAIALALGAEAVMLGSLLAGTDEAPGEVKDGMKDYYGMGSRRAMRESEASRKRYGQQGLPSGKRTAEGVEGQVQYLGPVDKILQNLVGGVQSSMGYLGVRSIEKMKHVRAVQITTAGQIESAPHHIYLQ